MTDAVIWRMMAWTSATISASGFSTAFLSAATEITLGAAHGKWQSSCCVPRSSHFASGQERQPAALGALGQHVKICAKSRTFMLRFGVLDLVRFEASGRTVRRRPRGR